MKTQVTLAIQPLAVRPDIGARMLGTTIGFVEQLLKDAVIPYRMLGATRVIDVRDLAAYLESVPKETGKRLEPVSATAARHRAHRRATEPATVKP